MIRGCCSEGRVHIFCLCGWRSVYWKCCSLGAHVAACARPHEDFGVKMKILCERKCLSACVSLILFGELSKQAVKPHSYGKCEFSELAVSRFKLPFWEPAFPALLKRAVRDWRALGMKRHGLVSVCPRFVYCSQ